MSKSLKKCFYEKLTYEKLLEAHYRASKGKKSKPYIIKFEIDLETSIMDILESIKNNTYKLGEYRTFTINDPKVRVIKALPYKDRVVHQWYVEEFIKPFFICRFINDSYACLENKGTHLAADKVQKYMKKMKKLYGEYYIIKFDIKKFFYNIDRDILFKILKKYFNDKKLLDFTLLLLKDDEEVKGVPIGNYTSQFFANIYLNELDKYIKNILGVKYYVRYMDDFIIMVRKKTEAKIIFDKVRIFLFEKLKLELNLKSSYYPSKYGADFCGYKIFETHRLLRKRFKKKVNKSLKVWKYLSDKGILNSKKKLLIWNSFLAHASHANSYNYINYVKNCKG